jgi:hypothetical protein
MFAYFISNFFVPQIGLDAESRMGVKEAASLAADRLGVPRRTAYNRAITLKDRA